MGLYEKLRALFGGAPGNGPPGSGAEGGDEMISCQEALERLFEYLDGELEEATEEEVARHFQVCRRCYPRLQFEKAFQQALQRVESGGEPPEELRRKVLQVLEGEGFDRS